MCEIWGGTSQSQPPHLRHVLAGTMGKASLDLQGQVRAISARAAECSSAFTKELSVSSGENLAPGGGSGGFQSTITLCWGCSQTAQRLYETLREMLTTHHYPPKGKGSSEGCSKYQRKVLAVNHFPWEADSVLWMQRNPRGRGVVDIAGKVLTESYHPLVISAINFTRVTCDKFLTRFYLWYFTQLWWFGKTGAVMKILKLAIATTSGCVYQRATAVCDLYLLLPRTWWVCLRFKDQIIIWWFLGVILQWSLWFYSLGAWLRRLESSNSHSIPEIDLEMSSCLPLKIRRFAYISHC